MNNFASEQEEKKAFWTWNIALWSGLAFVVAVNVWVAILAGSGAPDIVEDQPFLTGLQFENQQIARRNASERGYTIRVQNNRIVCQAHESTRNCWGGEIRLQRPNNKDLDRTMIVGSENVSNIELESPLSSGVWNARYQFLENGVPIEIDQKLLVQCNEGSCASR